MTPPGDVTIRRLGPGDVAAWRDLRLEALLRNPEAYGSRHADWASRPLADFVRRLTDAHVLGAERSGGLVGCLALDFDGDAASLTAVYVRASERRRGIAATLLRRALAVAAGHGAASVGLRVHADNAAARALYARFGFADLGPDDQGGPQQRRLRRDLAPALAPPMG